MKQIRLHFSDFWPGFEPKRSVFYRLIAKNFDVILTSDAPDYLICSVFSESAGNKDCRVTAEHYRHPDAISIMFTSENLLPDLNFCDYGIGFDHLSFGDRYLRVPLFAFYDAYHSLWDARAPLSHEDRGKKHRFCNFTVSNARAMPERDDMFARLNARKPVDSTGRHLRNSTALDDLQRIEGLTGPAAKRKLLGQYKFNIAFENSGHPGYTTEKLMEPLAARCVPIYLGNPRAAEDFNPAAFINGHDFRSMDDIVDEVLRLDADDDAYLQMVNAHPMPLGQQQGDIHLPALEAFLCDIISRPKDGARRRAATGRIGDFHQRLNRFSWQSQRWFRF